jgi:hypothetical protein
MAPIPISIPYQRALTLMERRSYLPAGIPQEFSMFAAIEPPHTHVILYEGEF